MTNTLKATPRMMGALAVRQLEQKHDALLARIEADPARPYRSNLSAAEQKLFHGRYDEAATALDEIRELLDARDHDRASKASDADIDAVRAENGQETRREPDKAITRDGWLWLLDKDKKDGRYKKAWMTAERALVGTAWRSLYLLSQPKSPRSSADDSISVGGGDTTEALARRVSAQVRHRKARQHIIDALGTSSLADLLDRVCGDGLSVRELAGSDDRRALVIETEMRIALDMAGVSFGMKR